ncbi:MAG: iron-containing alcohol dehydrogenase [Candidatus Brocadiae bacterium]|nr:iron-containing alcohol dehydrogenase [Candidatus Brocadiia bacterium]
MGESLQLNFPGVSHVGRGTLAALGKEAAALGSRALLVTGRRALRRAGITDRIVSLLRAAGVQVELFEDVPPEPDLAAVDAARGRARQAECDLLVEAGGGSAMDVGKVVAALAFEDAPALEYHRGRPIARPGLPHIAIATTAGTGAEVTRNAVITDPQDRVKKSIRGDSLMPTVSITDPELTLSCPPDVTAAAGMDALVQAVESFFSVHAIATTESLSLGAVRLAVGSLNAAFRDGRNLAARAAMSEASYMAGLALGSAGLGAVHGLAHPVGLCYDLPHGVVCAVLMPPVLETNAHSAPEKYERLREAMGGEPVQMFGDMLDRFGLRRVLGPYPDQEWLDLITEYAVSSGSAKANPAPVDEDYVRRILRGVCVSA